jgi:NAD(P)-dependent dehydrogenase (short-subunit alcohol dehydrogenase family)
MTVSGAGAAGDRAVRPLEGRRAIVTGAAGGLGRAICRALIGSGATVVGIDRVAIAADPVVGSLGTLVADLSDADHAKRAVDAAVQDLGGLDVVINNAGTVVSNHPLTSTWEDAVATFDRVVGDNYRATYLVGRAAIPHLVARGGDLVNVVTDHVHTCGYPIVVDHADAPGCPYADAPRPPVGSERVDVYDSSKWAVKGLTLVWATVLREYGVRVNSVGMGATDTPMYRERRGDRGLEPGTMHADSVAQVFVELLAEGPGGRTGDSVQLWIGHPCVLPPPGLDARVLSGR